ncbi:MAG: TonB-dependent receptor [Sphingobacteriaceae bacterium]|nr:TonB-dependent receptor [Sphingobacteriaceae bacterium]
MRLQTTIKKSILTLLTVCVSAIALAQSTGKISGTVTDKKTGETLVGVSVRIAGTKTGMSTGIDGKYSLNGLSTGKYTIEVSYIGYSTKSISEVEVTGKNNTILNVVLEEPSSQSLKEVVVRATAKQESVNTLYAQQKNSSRISDGISAEAIKKSPDKNTAEIMKRVSGVTVQDNKFVIIRGLSDRYNTATLDNGSLPSTEANRKAFSFDIVPSNMVDNIIISKTATPDMSGDFAGGSVQILTKDIPDQDFFSFGLGYGYNTQSTFKNFKGNERNTASYFGLDNSRNLPSNFPTTNQILNNTLTNDQSIAAMKSLNNDFAVKNSNAFLGQNYQASIGKVKTFENSTSKLGAIFSLSYRNSQIVNPEIYRELQEQFNFTDQTYKFSTNLGALANVGYVFGNHKITFKNIYNRIQDDQYLERTGESLNNNNFNKFYTFDVVQKTLFKTTLNGDHKLGSNKSKIQWTLGYSDVVNNQPDQRKVSYQVNKVDLNVLPYLANIKDISRENTRFFSNLTEGIFTGDVNFSLPVDILKSKNIFKVGLNSTFRDRKFDVRFLGLTLVNDLNNPSAFDLTRQRPLETLFGNDLIDKNSYKLNEIGNDADRYTSTSSVNSAYAMLDTKITQNARLVWGVRAEQFNLDLQTLDLNTPKVSRAELNILPSFNFTYNINEKSNFRASYSHTIARPEFRELSPFAYFDYEQNAVQRGNADLKTTQIQNVDLRYEIYPSAGQIISFSLFYKKFKNAIETTFYDVNSTPDISYSNAENANTYGAEIEFRKKLNFISENPIFANSTFYTNLSVIHSAVVFGTDTHPISSGRPLMGQSPYVINGGLQHTTLNNRLNFNLLYNRIGRRIFRVAGSVYPSVWEAPRDVFDFQIGLKLLKNKGEIKFNAADILNQNSVFYFDRNGDKDYTPGTDDSISRTRFGSNYSLAFSYSF